MDDPGFLVEEIKPGVEGGIGINMVEVRWELKTTGLEFGAEKVDNGITPHGL